MTHLCFQLKGRALQSGQTIRCDTDHTVYSDKLFNSFSDTLSEADVSIKTVSSDSVMKSSPSEQPAAAAEEPFAVTSVKVQKWLTPQTCLFCYETSAHPQTQSFQCTVSLQKHYQFVHFQYQISLFCCLIETYDVIIQNFDHFINHAVIIHKSDLRVRLSIMKVQHHTIKSEALATFRL